MKSVLTSLAVAITLSFGQGCSTIGQSQTIGSYVDDSVLTSRVKAALIKDEEVSGYGVEVETYEGVVQLSGFVKTHNERRRALDIARSVKGVSTVRDAMIVKR